MTEHDQDRAGGQAFDVQAMVYQYTDREPGENGYVAAHELAEACYAAGLAASRVTPEPAALRNLRELSEKATPGEWIRSKHCFQILTADSETSITELDCPRAHRTFPELRDKHQRNVEFIVACVNYVRAALAAGK